MTIVLGLLVALALGLGLWRLFSPWPVTRAAWAEMIGYSLVLGMLGCGLSMQVPSLLGGTALPTWRWTWPLLPALLAWGVVWFWRGRLTTVDRSHCVDMMPLPRVLLGLVLALVLVRLCLVLGEAWLRPLFGWDAWVAWSAKAKAWSLAEEVLPFVPGTEWLQQPAGAFRVSFAHHYPELLSWVEVWIAGVAGYWSEAVVNLAWPALWLALLAGSFGQWRILGADARASVLGLYALASMPLLTVHAALPGYADLWLGTCLAFALLSWLRWQMFRDRGQLGLALVFVAMLPMLKFEGMVWSVGVLALMLWFAFAGWSVPRRLSLIVLAATVVLVLSWWLHLQWLQTLIELLRAPSSGQSYSMLGAFGATMNGMFTQSNWHLLWYLVPVVLIWRWRSWSTSPGVAALASYVVVCIGLVLVLFVGTNAGRWAESFTAVNRILMHLVPTVITLLVLCFRASSVSSVSESVVVSPPNLAKHLN